MSPSSNSLESPVSARVKNGAEEGGDDSDIMWASLNFTNSIVGAGLIGMPYAIEKCGFLIGVIMMVVIAFIVRHSAILLIDCGMKMDAMDLEVLCGKVMGKYGYFLALGAMFVFAYGAQIAYMVIIGDTLPVVLKSIFPAAEIERNVVIVTVATCIILPLCLLKSIASLSYASGLSIFANIILVIIVCIRGPIAEHERHINEINGDFQLSNSSLFAGIGAMSFTFVCQHNSFLIFRSLKNPTRENWYKVATYAMSFALLICLVMGIAGYLSFFDFTKGNILNDFSIKGTVAG
jgi:solute carrier family 38 (sodium-coupled neutral amino acid transporter), member 11